MTLRPVRKRQIYNNRLPIMGMFLIGAGLMALGVAAWAVMPKPSAIPSSRYQPLTVPAKVEFPAPELSLTDLKGNPVSLADYYGQVVLVNNWATWCPPCKAEMPTLQAYYEDYRSQGFTIIGIEAGEPVREVADFVSEYGLTFPVWPDLRQEALAAFRNDALPNSYVIDQTGIVRLAWSGAISRETLEKYVTPLLEE